LKLRGGRYYEAVEAAASTGASGNKARNDIQKNRLSGPRQSPRLLLQQNLPGADIDANICHAYRMPLWQAMT
jgi:hypothetical protein